MVLEVFLPLSSLLAACFFLWNLNSGYIVSNDDVDDEQRIPQRSITQLFIRLALKTPSNAIGHVGLSSFPSRGSIFRPSKRQALRKN